MIDKICAQCPHLANLHIVVAGPTVGITVCPARDCECDLPVPGMKRPPPDFVAAVRNAIQYGKDLL